MKYNSFLLLFNIDGKAHKISTTRGKTVNLIFPDVVKCILLLKALLGLNVAP